MIPEVLGEHIDPCLLAQRWTISEELAHKLLCLASRVPFQIQIISGYRTANEQEKLIRDGRGAPEDRSTHRSCPATGADLWPLVAVTTNVKGYIGAACTVCQLRWGGGSKLDEYGMPSDWNHVDLGPRAA